MIVGDKIKVKRFDGSYYQKYFEVVSLEECTANKPYIEIKDCNDKRFFELIDRCEVIK